MKLFRNLAKSLYETFVPEAERQAAAVTAITDEQRAQLAITFFGREAALLERSGQTYRRAVQAAEDLIVSHHGAKSIGQVHRAEFVRLATRDHVQGMALGDLIESVLTTAQTSNPIFQANFLLEKIEASVTEAFIEKNPIKRRSVIRKAIKQEVPAFSSDQLNLAVELVIAIRG